MTQVDEVGFSCNACGKQYRWKPELAGKAVKCKCGSPLRVPKAPPTAARAHVPPPPPPKPAQPVEDDGGDMDALYALAAQEASSADEASAAADSGTCPGCRSALAPDAVLCTQCGFDRRRGSAIKIQVEGEDDGQPKRRLFGMLAPAKVDPSRKKAVDKMAPQGSFMAGVAVSVGLAVCAALVWFLVAWLIGWEVYFLVTLVGIAAGVGMQIGQKGYSTIGGFAAAGITLVVMLLARVAVIVAVVLPGPRADASDHDDDEAPRARTEVKSSREMMEEQMERYLLIKADEQARRDAEQAKQPQEDPRLIEALAEEFHTGQGREPRLATGDQVNAAYSTAKYRATTMPAAEKQKRIAVIAAREDKEELLMLKTEDMMNEVRKAKPDYGGGQAYEAMQNAAQAELQKMSPEAQKFELQRLRDNAKTEFAEAMSEDDEDAEEGLGDEEAVTAAPVAAPPSGDGFGEEPADAPAPPVVSATPAERSPAGNEGEAGVSDAVTFGVGAFLVLLFFGGIKSFLFMIGTLFLAYRTAAGSTWG